MDMMLVLVVVISLFERQMKGGKNTFRHVQSIESVIPIELLAQIFGDVSVI